MKRRLNIWLLLTFFVLNTVFINIHCQFDENFENWTINSEDEPFNWNYPTGWLTSNGLTEFIKPSVFKSDNAFSGQYAAEIRNTKLFNEYYPGTLITNNAIIDFINFDVIGQSPGIPMSLEPMQLKGWYQFSSDAADEEASVTAIIFRTDPSGAETINSESTTKLVQNDAYAQFTVPIELGLSFNPSKDMLRIVIKSSSTELNRKDARLLIDDITLETNSRIVDQHTEKTFSIAPSIVSRGGTIMISSVTEASDSYLVFDSKGVRQSIEISMVDNQTNVVKTGELPTGKYFIINTKSTGAYASFIIVN